MFAPLRDQVRRFVDRVAARVEKRARHWTRPRASVFLGVASDLVRPKTELVTENALLRQQLIVLRRQTSRVRITPIDRVRVLLLARLAKSWQDAVFIVKPETIFRWHRTGFRLFWKRKSKTKRRSPRLPSEVVDLIRHMAVSNRLWGAERIRGELLKLGIHLSKRTIQRYLRRFRPPRKSGQTWTTFVGNHAHEIWACDFLQTYDVLFRPIFAFVIIELGSRKVVHVAVTRSPSQTWTTQQLRNATPWGTRPRFLIRDNDDKYGTAFDAVAMLLYPGVQRVVQSAGRVIRSAHDLGVIALVGQRFCQPPFSDCLPQDWYERDAAELVSRNPGAAFRRFWQAATP